MNVRRLKISQVTAAAAIVGCLLPGSAWAIDVASQADYTAALAAVAAAPAGSTVAINFTGNFTLTSSLPLMFANSGTVTVNINGNGHVIDGASQYQGIQISGSNSPTVNISNLALTNTTATGGTGQDGQDGYYNAALSYGSGGGGGGGLGAGGGLLVGNGANVTLSAVTFTGNNATGGAGGNGGSAQTAGPSGTGGDGGNGGRENLAGTVGGGGGGGIGGNTGTQGTDGSFSFIAGEGGGGGGGSGTNGGTTYTTGNAGGSGAQGAGTGGNGGRGAVDDTADGGGPGADGGNGGNGGDGRGGAVYVGGGTLTVLDSPITGATTTGGAGGLGGTGGGTGAINGANGATGGTLGSDFYLNNAMLNIGVSTGALTYSGSIAGVGLNTGLTTTAITKTGAGTLALAASNAFSGDVAISAGTLSIAADSDLGAAGNGVIMSDGTTLAVTGTTTLVGTRGFQIAGNSTLDIASGTTTTLSGVISDGVSSGSLVKQGAGTLALSGVNLFTGNVDIDAGTLSIGNDTSLGAAGNSIVLADGTTLAVTGTTALAASRSVRIAGNSTFDIASGTTTTVQGGIADGASAGNLLKSGTGTLVLGGVDIYTGATFVNAGTLSAGSASALPSSSALTIATGAVFDLNGFDAAAGSLSGDGSVTNDGGIAATLTTGGNGADSQFSGVIQDGASATGLTKVGAGKLTLTGINTYSGATTVNDGTLDVNGSIANSPTTVNAGRLMGTGILGDTMIAAGGTHAPGNSIGTQTVNGAYVNHGTLEIEAQPDSADQVAVNGTVDITNAKLDVIALPGSWNPSQSYTIILNDGADPVAGSFSSVSSSLVFLDPSVDYTGGTGNDVVLTLQRNASTVTSFGTTFNQRAVGGAIDQLGMGNGVYDAFLGLNSAAEVARALQLSSGESYATDMEVMQETASLFTRGLLERAGGSGSAAVNTGMGDAGSVNGYVETPLISEAADAISGITPKQPEAVRTAWFAPVGAHGHIDGDGNAVSASWNSGGLSAGYEFGETMGSGDFLGGIAVGYLHTNVDTDGNLTTEKTDGGQLGFYGRWIGGPVTVSGAVAGGLSQSRTDRRIDIAGLDLRAKSKTWNQVLDASTEVAYAIPLQADFTLSPLASLTGVFIHRNGTAESGAGAFDLDVDSKSHGQLTPGLGIELSHASDVKNGVVNTHIRTVWEHVIGDTVDQSLRFAGTDAGYTVKAPDLNRDRLRLGLGISYQTTNRWSLFADYEGVFSSSTTQHAGRIGAKVLF